jgi:hypothetical protein
MWPRVSHSELIFIIELFCQLDFPTGLPRGVWVRSRTTVELRIEPDLRYTRAGTGYQIGKQPAVGHENG